MLTRAQVAVDDGLVLHRLADSKVASNDDRLASKRKNLQRQVVDFASSSRRRISITEDDSEASVSNASKTLDRLFNRRLRDGVFQIFRHIQEKASRNLLVKAKQTDQVLNHLIERRLKSSFAAMRNAKSQGEDDLDSKVLLHKKRTVLKTIRDKQHLLFLKLIKTFVGKSVFKHQSFFFIRLQLTHQGGVDAGKLKKLDLLMQKLILRRVGPSFKNIHRFKSDTFTADSVNNFMDMMNYLMSNRLSQGFASVRSFVMHFEVLRVEEIHGDDYKVKFMEVVDKFKVLSERSFDINNLSAMAMDDAGRASYSSAAQNDVLDAPPTRQSNRVILTKK